MKEFLNLFAFILGIENIHLFLKLWMVQNKLKLNKYKNELLILGAHHHPRPSIESRDLKYRRRKRRRQRTAPWKDWVENVVHGEKIRKLLKRTLAVDDEFSGETSL